MTLPLSTFTSPSATGYRHSQRALIAEARRWLAHDVLVLDTEATGLGAEAEIIEIAVMRLSGEVLLDTLIKPTQPVPRESTLIHGLATVHLAQAPDFPTVYRRLWPLLQGRTVLTYGMAFDYRLLVSNARLHGLTLPAEIDRAGPPLQLVDGTRLHCLMQRYAQFWQEPTLDSRSQDGWRRKSLAIAARDQGIVVQTTHRALPDCRLKVALVQALAGEPETWHARQVRFG